MKKLLSIFVFIGLLLTSCSSSDDGGEIIIDDPNSNELTYVGTIRSIINSNCTSCHGNPPTNNAPMPLTTYSEVRGAVETRNLLGRINSSTNPMPPTGQLPSGTRQLIEDWVDLGMPEN
ncbi:MAG: hypothetical protein OER83_03205 [Flavobacteriaceae bacterium]|nr:hypothetical protein [Flavobacteriaceae bacterium]MDH3795861.1 hypothetical protein [Flavobacteriaceae bacterium]